MFKKLIIISAITIALGISSAFAAPHVKAACNPTLVVEPIIVNVGEPVLLGTNCKGGPAGSDVYYIAVGDGTKIFPDSIKNFRTHYIYSTSGVYEVQLVSQSTGVVDSESVTIN